MVNWYQQEYDTNEDNSVRKRIVLNIHMQTNKVGCHPYTSPEN